MANVSSDKITFRIKGAALADSNDGARGVQPLPPGRDGSALTHDLQAAADGTEFVLLKIAGGPELRLHPENAKALLQSQTSAAGTRDGIADDGAINVPPRLVWKGGSAARGDVLGAAVEWFKVVTGAAPLEKRAAEYLAAKIDGQVKEALYALSAAPFGSLTGRPPAEVSETVVNAPALVFVHGTFSSTAGSFGDLWKLYPDVVAALVQKYGPHIYGFDHATLARSPEENAMTLYASLPRGATVHLVTHSRGGLIGELLARSAITSGDAFSADDLASYPANKKASEIAALISLNKAFKGANAPRITRVVRVACPAYGTTLASGRLDAYFSVLSWGLKAAGAAVASEVVKFLDAVARQRTDPEVLPGVEAMRPESTLVQVLNAHDRRVDGQLRVIAGDLQGDTVWSWVKQLMSDAFYWEDNDIVVQTRSMYGGAERTGEASFLLDRGGKTDHFHYFANPNTAQALRLALLSDALPDGFRLIGPQSFAGKDASGVRGERAAPLVNNGTRPLVIVLPGIMGSNLKRTVDGDSAREWFNGWRVFGALGRLELPANDAKLVSPDGSIARYYENLQGFLNQDFDVIDFSYDWRLPIEDAAARLGDIVVAEVKARIGKKLPVSLIAHSMGGIVARAMQFAHPAGWSALKSQSQVDWYFVMLGTPNGGSYAPMQALTGDAGTLVSTMEAVGVNPFSSRTARQVVAGFVGLLQLQADLLDPQKKLGDPAEWERLRAEAATALAKASIWHDGAGSNAPDWGLPGADTLKRAVALRRLLDQQRANGDLNALPLRLVLGTAPSTPTEIVVTAMGATYATTTEGDGRVTWESARLPGVRTWMVPCVHGDLSAADEHFALYRDLLTTGDTRQLKSLRSSRGEVTAATDAALIAAAPAGVRVRNADPMALLIGGSDGGRDQILGRPPTPTIAVSVLHGDMRYIDGALLIGHYSGSPLAGPERILDQLLGGSMQRSLAAGLYPFSVGTADVFVNLNHPEGAAGKPRVVVVTGLGADGQSKTSDVRAAVQQAVLCYSRFLGESSCTTSTAGTTSQTVELTPRTFTLHTLSIGSGGGLPLPACVTAAVEGALDAADIADRQGWPRLDRLCFVELYGNRASEALQTLRRREQLPEARFSVQPDALVQLTGARLRPPTLAYRSADHDLVNVSTELSPIDASKPALQIREISELEFSLFTKRSRSEVRGKAVQPNLVASLVKSAQGQQSPPDGLGLTLFKLLVPLEMQGTLRGSDALMFDLDRFAASLPWEFLDDRGESPDTNAREPLAVRVPFLRRLRTSNFRNNPLDATIADRYLVIGSPKTPSNYPDLPAARSEALAVASVLETEALNDKGAQDLISPLINKPWRIVHIAGHGALGTGGADTGVVLENGCFLGPREIRSMTTVPELVFVNCCHLGNVQQRADEARPVYLENRPLFASSVAEELIDIGVRCVIVAGWAVNDETASLFATTFYSGLLKGLNFRDAVQMARREAFRHGEGNNTWAAYQCYGDGNWKLKTQAASPSAPTDQAAIDPINISGPDDLVLFLDEIFADSAVMGRDQSALSDRLMRLDSAYGARWGASGSVAEAFGRAYRGLHQFDKAVLWLEAAISAQDGKASIAALEQWVNLKARLLFSSLGGGVLTAATRKELEAITRKASMLTESFPTGERWAILGSVHKRVAMHTKPGTARTAALRSMLAAYDSAFQFHKQHKSDECFYPAMQCVAAALATGAVDPRTTDWLDAAEAALARLNATRPNFWSQIAAIETGVLRAMINRQLPDDKKILEFMAVVYRTHQRKSEWDSVRSNLDFLTAGLAGSKGRRGAPQLMTALKALRAHLDKYC